MASRTSLKQVVLVWLRSRGCLCKALVVIKLEMVKPVKKLAMLVPGSCCDKAADGEAGDGRARDVEVSEKARDEAADREDDEAVDSKDDNAADDEAADGNDNRW